MSATRPGFTVSLTDEARGDVKTLGERSNEDRFEKNIAKEVVLIAKAIKQHPWHGEPLREDGQIPVVEGLRKVPFDPDPQQPLPRFRLVYQLLPDDGPNPSGAEIVAIGPRRNLEVYEIAARRTNL